LDEWLAHCNGLYLHKTTHHRNTNIHAPSGIRTHEPSNQAAKTYVLASVATGTGSPLIYPDEISHVFLAMILIT
jgi:hypothetical protein